MRAIAYSTKAYQTAEAHAADPNHLVVLMFDSAVRFLHRAMAAMRAGDCEGQCTYIIRTQRIFSTLMASLDLNVEPQLASGLFNLYNWIHGNLTEASIRDDLQLLEEIITIASSLQNAWRQAEANCRQVARGAGEGGRR